MKIFLVCLYFAFYFGYCLGQPTQHECYHGAVEQRCDLQVLDSKIQQLTSQISNVMEVLDENAIKMKNQNDEIARLKGQLDFLNNSANTGNESLENCAQLYKAGNRDSGVYNLSISDSQCQHKTLQVYCDMDTPGGGWTVFQRRQDGSVSFAQNWDAYKHGFGHLDGEHWLGNDMLSVMAASYKSIKLRVDFESFNGEKLYAEYQIFGVDHEEQNYKLTVGSFSGTAGNGMLAHNGMMFSTVDRDNDRLSRNCAAIDGGGGFWYNNCDSVGANGVYRNTSGVDDTGIHWDAWSKNVALRFFEMKFRPSDYC